MVEWIPGAEKSPDRIDALVWSLTALDLSRSYGQVPKSPLPDVLDGRDHSFFGSMKMPQIGRGEMPHW